MIGNFESPGRDCVEIRVDRMGVVGCMLGMPAANSRWWCWRCCSSFFLDGCFVGGVVAYSLVAHGERSHCVFRKPGRFPLNFKGDVEDGCILILRVYAGKFFWCKSIVDVLTEVFCGELVSFQLVDMVNCLM